MAKPRLLYILHQHGNPGGVELHTQTLVDALADRFDTFITYADLASQRIVLLHNGDKPLHLPADPFVYPLTPYHLPATERAFTEICNRVCPDLIHLQHFLSWPLSVIDLSMQSGAKVVISFPDYYAISPDFMLLGESDPLRAFTREYAVDVFGQDVTAYLRERRQWMHNSLSRVHARIAVSAYCQRIMQRVYPLEYRLIEYGIRGFEPPPARPDGAGLRFGFVGALALPKGFTVLLDAFARVRAQHRTAELRLYGAGEAPPPPYSPGVTFCGPYRASDLPRICSEFDVAVIPSLFAETYCMVLSEMWMGRKAVATADIGAMSDRVIDYVNGRKFPAGDAIAMANVMRWFIQSNDWRHWNLPKPKTANAMCAEYDALYRELLAGA